MLHLTRFSPSVCEDVALTGSMALREAQSRLLSSIVLVYLAGFSPCIVRHTYKPQGHRKPGKKLALIGVMRFSSTTEVVWPSHTKDSHSSLISLQLK